MKNYTQTLVVIVITLVVGVVVIFSVHSLYTYFVERPPRALVEIVTKTEPPPPLPLGKDAPLVVPEGYSATIFSRDVPGARVMIRDQRNVLLISETKEGKVVALPDADSNNEADQTVVVLQGLKEPHGLLLLCGGRTATEATSTTTDPCTLYVAETGELKSYEYDAEKMTATYLDTLTSFPTGDGHFTRSLLLSPAGDSILISVGSSCNVCEEEDSRRASILSLDLKTGEVTPYAHGLRNSVFLAIDPKTNNVWASENGRDMIGDDIPPDEINIIEEGKNYGWPICYGQNIHDTNFDTKQYIQDPCTSMTAAHIDLQAHSAALGLAFVPEEGWDSDWAGDLLVAYHGSWNRREPTGYKVVRFDLDPSRRATSTPHDVITGFLPEGVLNPDKAIGRPVGLLAEAGGVLYVSDDRAGAVYRVTKEE